MPDPHRPSRPARLDEAQLGRALYLGLKQDITSLQLPPGAQLRESDVAARWEASRTPAREALRGLVQDGLLVREGRHYTVRRFSPREVRDLYEVREGLEKMAVTLAIERAGAADFDRLLGAIDQQLAAALGGELALFNQLDTHFHLEIAAMAANAELLRQLRLLHDQVLLIRVVELSRADGAMRAVDDHRRIVTAMRRRDVAAAEAEMRYHLRSIIALYHGRTEPRPDGAVTEFQRPAIPPAKE